MLRSLLLVLIAGLTIAGCAATARNAIPPRLADTAEVIGLERRPIRFWGDTPPKALAEATREMDHQRRIAAKTDPRLSLTARQSILVISGGGSDGAFGAGLLNGWTTTGTRPEFLVVTGVSTGALIAPFAFLGPQYDKVLKEFYTLYETKDILRPTVLAGLFGGSSVASSEPLAGLIAKYMTRTVMKRIAAEHARGRRLLVGTTNLDAERPVIWNIGQIATAGTDRSLRLIRQVLLASASIPGVFPPVMIDVHVGGKKRQEMHVDGGTTENAILLPVQTDLKKINKKGRRPAPEIYVIVNSHLDPQYQSVKPSTLDIASRSISTLIKQKTLGDILKLYDFAKRNGLRYRLAMIPASYQKRPKEAFDRAYMTALFEAGQKLGQQGYKWATEPPVR
ncbi:MAG: patatin-like phospholipase family protein [Hyphomicrobiaceae bacterium]|nr:patatin-like phospholipase family protein [Hyphomicrobiaceae bacterium]